MKKKILPVAGIISVIVLISVQAFIIGQIWHQKNELFQLNYSKLSEKALEYFDKAERTNGFEEASYLIDLYSSDFVVRDSKIYTKSEPKAVANGIVMKEVSNILNRNQELNKLITSYFKKNGYDVTLKPDIEIHRFLLFDYPEDYFVYNRDNFINLPPPKGKIFVNRFIIEGNHYRMVFDFYIDITDQRAIVFREMTTSLVLSTLSIAIVLMIFLLAYKYLMEEKRLSDLKTDFINNMTHELKTPLSTITVASKTLEIDQILSNRDKIVETARIIGKQSLNLNHLINLILEISIWERTEFEPEIKEIYVGSVLSEIVESFSTGHRDSASITSSISLEGVTMKADITYFTTMINNLLSNAVKFSPGNCKIHVSATTNGSEISISITDNGIGISKNDQKHIFDKFYRVSHGDLHKTKGLGLGLYYVSRIAASHNGKIEVDSQPGKGSTFTIKIPV